MSNTLNCFDQESKLEHFLSDLCRQFYHCVVSEKQIIIYVSGYLGDLDKEQIVHDVKSQFPELGEKDIVVMDVQDRQERTDTNRRHLEKKIREQVSELVAKGEIGVNDITYVWLRFTLLSRIGRGLGYDSDAIVMKVATDPEKRAEVEEALMSLAKQHNIPLSVRGATLWREAQYQLQRFKSQ